MKKLDAIRTKCNKDSARMGFVSSDGMYSLNVMKPDKIFHQWFDYYNFSFAKQVY